MRAEEHLERALRNLHAARSNMDSGFFEVAVNRSYYAAFEAARAALRELDLPLPRSHSGLASKFGQHAVKDGLVREEAGRLLGKLEQDRLLADYEGDIPDREDAQDSLRMAKIVVESVRASMFSNLPGIDHGLVDAYKSEGRP